ncbi:unnamed protein product [Trichogramma brassicae]|uniref:Uncharacterized protein n=1 Tax=Trichogramma brassicae TaxID=86971 RepID=A0A6H5J5W3_9HYME|nr:unnamed protein product [Trichogramma brassicae]
MFRFSERKKETNMRFSLIFSNAYCRPYGSRPRPRLAEADESDCSRKRASIVLVSPPSYLLLSSFGTTRGDVASNETQEKKMNSFVYSWHARLDKQRVPTRRLAHDRARPLDSVVSGIIDDLGGGLDQPAEFKHIIKRRKTNDFYFYKKNVSSTEGKYRMYAPEHSATWKHDWSTGRS